MLTVKYGYALDSRTLIESLPSNFQAKKIHHRINLVEG